MCMMRTTFGNPHYINDVMENYYRFVGEGNRERIQNRSTAYPVSSASSRRRAPTSRSTTASRRTTARPITRCSTTGACRCRAS